MTTIQVGAFFQCYKQPYATYNALQNFRQAYPNTSIVLLSDNGYNYKNMADHFNAEYIHSNKNCRPSTGGPHGGKVEDTYMEFVNRFKSSLDLIKEDYFMLLEDDVFTKSPYTEQFLGTINGNCPNYIRADILSKIPYYKGPIVDRLYTGHGGAIFNKKEILHALNNYEIVDWLIKNWKDIIGLVVDSDVFLSILVYTCGLSIHPLFQHVDGMNLFHSGNVIHQYKDLYNIDPPSYIKNLYD